MNARIGNESANSSFLVNTGARLARQCHATDIKFQGGVLECIWRMQMEEKLDVTHIKGEK
jgi:hypothetical protein